MPGAGPGGILLAKKGRDTNNASSRLLDPKGWLNVDESHTLRTLRLGRTRLHPIYHPLGGVRASYWPLCDGPVIPRSPQAETLIEYTHRLTSGASLLLVVGLVVWAFRAFPWGHQVRYGAALGLVFMLLEVLVGAGLVVFALVAGNDSLARAAMLAVHLANTFVLLAMLALTAWWVSGGEPLRLQGQGGTRLALCCGPAGGDVHRNDGGC